MHGPASVHSVRSCSAITYLRKIFPSTLGLSAHRHQLFTGSPASRSPRPDSGASFDGLSPTMGDGWATMVNTPLLLMFQTPSSSPVKNNNNPTSQGQTVDFAAAKLNDLYGGSNNPRLDGPKKFRRTSKGHMHDITQLDRRQQRRYQNGVYGDDGDLISGHRVPSASSRGGSDGDLHNGGSGGGGSNWSGAQSRSPTPLVDSVAATTEAERWHNKPP